MGEAVKITRQLLDCGCISRARKECYFWKKGSPRPSPEFTELPIRLMRVRVAVPPGGRSVALAAFFRSGFFGGFFLLLIKK